MSEKIKGMFGSKTRANEVLEWLKSQGAGRYPYIVGSVESNIYYVDQGEVRMVDRKHSVLFDIVELPRWRAESCAIYYYASDSGSVMQTRDTGHFADDDRYRLGNYFKTVEEAKPYAEKIREIFKAKL